MLESKGEGEIKFLFMKNIRSQHVLTRFKKQMDYARWTGSFSRVDDLYTGQDWHPEFGWTKTAA